MQLEKSLEEALQSAEPVLRLRDLVRQWMSQGKEKTTVLGLLEESREELRRAGREQDEDVVMDVMDFLLGWCSPQMNID